MLYKQHSINHSKTKNSPLGCGGAVGGIFLIGMMGSGKSYWSKQIAHVLQYTAYDLDTLIEAGETKTIARIFADNGEDYFRKAESAMLRSFAAKKNFVLATGGGTPCFYDNMQWMNLQGITIWLDEPIDILVQRLQQEKSHRPLIKNLEDHELKSFLLTKLEERKPFYGQAKIRWAGEENLLHLIQQG